MWEKVVLNLLSNAFKFTFEGEIAVSLRRAGDAAELRVRDTGTGIPAEEMPRLFERFHRVEDARGRTHEGSGHRAGAGAGAGQAARRLHRRRERRRRGHDVHRHRAARVGPPAARPDRRPAAAPSPTGAGAGPYVEEALRWLPDEGRASTTAAPDRRPSRAAADRSTADRGRTPGDDRPRVLVADDNADMRQYVARLLAEQYRVEAVPDGEAALAAARERPPDLILTDVMMPRLDGFGLLRELRADPRTGGLPVIMLSARAGEESRVEGMEAGADDYLVKPFSARELLARVSAHLQMARMRREAERVAAAGRGAAADGPRRRPHGGLAIRSRRPANARHPANAAEVFGLPPGSGPEDDRSGVRPRPPRRRRAAPGGGRRGRSRSAAATSASSASIRPDDGAVVWMEERGHAVRDGPGRPCGSSASSWTSPSGCGPRSGSGACWRRRRRRTPGSGRSSTRGRCSPASWPWTAPSSRPTDSPWRRAATRGSRSSAGRSGNAPGGARRRT